MVLIAGPAQIPWKALRNYVGQSRLTMASAEEVREVTGYEIGAVGPFGLRRPVRVLVEASVLAQEEVSLGSGLRGTAILLRVDHLIQALGEVEVASLGIEAGAD